MSTKFLVLKQNIEMVKDLFMILLMETIFHAFICDVDFFPIELSRSCRRCALETIYVWWKISLGVSEYVIICEYMCN